MKTVVKSLLAIGLLTASSTALWVYNTRTPSGICVSEGRVLSDEEIVRRYLHQNVKSGSIGRIKADNRHRRIFFNPEDLKAAYPNSVFEPFASVEEYLELVPDCCILSNEGENPRVLNFENINDYAIPKGSKNFYILRPPPRQYKTSGMEDVARVQIVHSIAIKMKNANGQWNAVFKGLDRTGATFVDRNSPKPIFLNPSWIGNCGQGVWAPDEYFGG